MAVLRSQLKLTLIDQVSGRLKGISAALAGFQSRQRAMMAPLAGSIGRMAAFGGAYLGVTAGMRGTIGAAMDFESAFADVRKVVDANEQQFANMSRTIKQMSKELPLTAVEISQLFAAAGESGVATNELKAFSEMAARVGIAFDMTAGEAGDSLAKLKAQLGLTVDETGEMADAINHLSNNMASKAADITAYMLRVGKFAEMGGFAKEQVAALGSAMISAGAQAETAGTAMMNVVRKMTTGEFAKKDQREAAKALGLDLPTLAKQMKKDAPKALKTVLKAIAKAPEEKQIALLSKFFGDEARAFAPLVGNIELLDKALDSVADRTQYAGSAFKEFVARAATTENALKLLRNRIAYVFEDIGAAWLPSVKEAAAAIGDVLDSLGERATPFDRFSAAMQGFLRGLGYDGTLRSVIEDIADMFLGVADGSSAADTLGRIGKNFEDFGKSVREVNDAIRDSPIAQFFGSLAGYGFKFMLVSVGIGLLAGVIRKLAAALFFLSGAKAAVSILRTLAGLGGKLKPPKLPGTPETKPGAPKPAGKPSPWGSGKPGARTGGPTGPNGGQASPVRPAVPGANWGGMVKGLFSKGTILAGLGYAGGQWAIGESLKRFNAKLDELFPSVWNKDSRSNADEQLGGPGILKRAFDAIFGGAIANGEANRGNDVNGVREAIAQIPTLLDQQNDWASIAETIRPKDNQPVTVTNPTPVHAPVNVTVYATTNASPDAIGAAVGAKVKGLIDGAYLDAH